jgi:hypothetical protein
VDIDVRPEPVIAAARRFAADRAAGASRAGLARAATAGRAHPEWAAGKASDACVAAWQARLHTLGASADAAAQALNRAMDVYVSTEAGVARELRQQATWLDGA